MQGGFACSLADLQRAQDLYEQLICCNSGNTVNGIVAFTAASANQQARDYTRRRLQNGPA
jgi:hypothetical protein